jgi:hypothetical protein
MVFDALVRYADYKTGANCAPEIDDLAKELGRSRQSVARHIRQLRTRGIVEAIPLRTPRGRWNRNGYRFVGHGFASPEEFGNLRYLKPSRTPRRAARPRGADGRFACGPNVTIGCGPNVTIGDGIVWTKSDQSDLAVTSDPAFDPSALASAPKATTLAEPAKTTRVIDQKPAGFAVDDLLWMSQFTEQQREIISETGGGA